MNGNTTSLMEKKSGTTSRSQALLGQALAGHAAHRHGSQRHAAGLRDTKGMVREARGFTSRT